jgi:hypothetical protein
MISSDSIARLKSQLLTSGLSDKNQPLFQIINALIDAVGDSLVAANIVVGGGSGSGSSGLQNATYLTIGIEAGLPFSRRLVAGIRITFDDSVAGVRTANVAINEVILTGANETATLPNSRRLLAGTGLSFDDSVANQRTINSTVTADYVVASDGGIPTPLPLDDGAGNFIYVPYTP